MFATIFNRGSAPNSTPPKVAKQQPSLRVSMETDGVSTAATGSLAVDMLRTPKARRKSDIHELLPEMLYRTESEGETFHVLSETERLTDLYKVDAAFYSVGAKTVTMCTHLVSGKTYIMKRRAKQGYGAETERHWRRVMEKLMRIEACKNIVYIHEVLEDNEAYYVVMEACNAGQLFDLLLRESSMTQRECKRIIREILTAVGHLHENGLIHRDLKPENIMLTNVDDEKDLIKLIDFDTCDEIATRRLSIAVTPSESKRPLRRRSSVIIGTLGYIAPESFNGDYSTASDLFSIGVIFFILMTGDMPFDDTIYHITPEDGEEKDLQLAGSPRAKNVHSRLIHANIDWNMAPWPQLPLAKDLCQQLLDVDPDTRLCSAKEALMHPWLSTVAGSKSIPPTPKHAEFFLL